MRDLEAHDEPFEQRIIFSYISEYAMRIIIVFCWLLCCVTCLAQEIGFTFGTANTRELEASTFTADTSATAVILKEYGEAYIDYHNDHNLIFEYHAKIKILKQPGVKVANYEIALLKTNGGSEILRTVRASSFSLEKGAIVETKLEYKNVFTENHERYDLKKFAIPNVRPGSIIDVQYVMESPVFYHFRSWNFQSRYPKVISEYRATIPATYHYNITLKGFLKLSKNQNTILKDCFAVGPGRADCVRYHWEMIDIPSFVEEDYMTAPSNYISSVNFELAEIRQFNGWVDKITSSWKEVELELKRDVQFGLQLKRGKDVLNENISSLLLAEKDQLSRAKLIYQHIRDSYIWNGYYSKYSDNGIKKAFEHKEANIGDINLSLIAALRYAGIPCDPVLLSTRDNGLPTSIHPVLTDFNYVIARVALPDTVYYLDASDDFYPFGMLPQRCFNGKARWLGQKKSRWVDLAPLQKGSRHSTIRLTLGEDGAIRGNVETVYSGYEAVRMRKRFYTAADEQAYREEVKSEFPTFEVSNIELSNVERIELSLTQKFDITIPAQNNTAGYLFLNPFFTCEWKENPFKAATRLFPVDFATPIEHITILHLEYPADSYEVDNIPGKQTVDLPAAAGIFSVESTREENRITLQNVFSIYKTVFSTAEYQSLKELFNKMLEIQNTDILIRKKV